MSARRGSRATTAAVFVTGASLCLSACGGSGRTSITLRFAQTQTTEHLEPAPGGSPVGVMDVITTNLASGGKVVGHGRIVGVAVDFPNVQIIRTDELPGGHLSTMDTYNDSVKAQDLAVVGGTGSYRGAQGTLTLTQLGGNNVGVVYRISVPSP